MPKPRHRTVAVFAGQFDPITKGHLDVILRGAKLFDKLVVAVGVNPDKSELFNPSERVELIQALVRDRKNIDVRQYSGLTIDFFRKVKGTVLLRGIRDVSDLRYEFQLAQANHAVGKVETVFMMTGDRYALISSSLIRQIVSMSGDVRILSGVLPQVVIKRLSQRQRKK